VSQDKEWEELHMKLRIITFAFVACLASSFVFADNPTDAPLMPSDENTTVAQQENQPSHKPERSRKMDNSMSTSAKAKRDHSMKDNRQKQQSDPEYPATNDNFAGTN
jgi:hypothetical protein